MQAQKNTYNINSPIFHVVIVLCACFFSICESKAQKTQSRMPTYPTRLIEVEISCLELFDQIDSIISNTDLTITVKPERHSLIRPLKYINFREPRIISGVGKSWNETVFWFSLYAREEDDYLFDYYYFRSGKYIYTSPEWIPLFYVKKTKKTLNLGRRPVSLIFSDHNPSWLFKIEYGKITQAIYHVEELDDFQEPGYDLLNHMIISEGIMEIEPTK